MRGDDPRHESMFSYLTPEQRVRADHPLRPIRRMTDAALAAALAAPGPVGTRRWGARRFPRSNCCARCCCRCSIAFAASAS